jgi:hypothetical protein
MSDHWDKELLRYITFTPGKKVALKAVEGKRKVGSKQAIDRRSRQFSDLTYYNDEDSFLETALTDSKAGPLGIPGGFSEKDLKDNSVSQDQISDYLDLVARAFDSTQLTGAARQQAGAFGATDKQFRNSIFQLLRNYYLPQVLENLEEKLAERVEQQLQEAAAVVVAQQNEERFVELTRAWDAEANRLYGADLTRAVARKGNTDFFLFPCQKEAVRWILSSHKGILAHDMGLGKTLTASVAYYIMQRAVPGFQVDVIAPSDGLCEAAWKPTLAMFDGFKFRLTYKDAMGGTGNIPCAPAAKGGQGARPLIREERPEGFGVIVDEAHVYENPATDFSIKLADLLDGNLYKPSPVAEPIGLQRRFLEGPTSVVSRDFPLSENIDEKRSLLLGRYLDTASNLRRNFGLTLLTSEKESPSSLTGEEMRRFLDALLVKTTDATSNQITTAILEGDPDSPKNALSLAIRGLELSYFGSTYRQGRSLLTLEPEKGKVLLLLSGPAPIKTTHSDHPSKGIPVGQLIREQAEGEPIRPRGDEFREFNAISRWVDRNFTDKQALKYIQQLVKLIELQRNANKGLGDGYFEPIDLVKKFGFTSRLDFNRAIPDRHIDEFYNATFRVPWFGLPAVARVEQTLDGKKYITTPTISIPGQQGGGSMLYGTGIIPQMLAVAASQMSADDPTKRPGLNSRLRQTDDIRNFLSVFSLNENILAQLYSAKEFNEGNWFVKPDGIHTEYDGRFVPTATRFDLYSASTATGRIPGFALSPARLSQQWARNYWQVGAESYKKGLGNQYPGRADELKNPTTGGFLKKSTIISTCARYANESFWFQRAANPPDAVTLLSGTPMKNARPDDLWPLLSYIRHPLTQLQVTEDPTTGFPVVVDSDARLRAYQSEFNNRGIEGGLLWIHDQLKDRGPMVSPRGALLWRSKQVAHPELVEQGWSSDPYCLTGLGDKQRIFVNVRPQYTDRINLPDKVIKSIIKYRDSQEADFKEGSQRGERAVARTAESEAIAQVKAPITAQFAIKLLKSGEKVVIFTQHKKAALEIAEIIDSWLAAQNKGYEPVQLLLGTDRQGKTISGEQREQVETQFQTNPRVRAVVASYKVGSTGYTLTEAARLILNDLPYEPASIRQAEDRIFRIGQKRNPEIYWMQLDLPLSIEGQPTKAGADVINQARVFTKISQMETLLAGEALGSLEGDRIEPERSRDDIFVEVEETESLPLGFPQISYEVVDTLRPKTEEILMVPAGDGQSIRSIPAFGPNLGRDNWRAPTGRTSRKNVRFIQRLNKAGLIEALDEDLSDLDLDEDLLGSLKQWAVISTLENADTSASDVVAIKTSAKFPEIYFTMTQPTAAQRRALREAFERTQADPSAETEDAFERAKERVQDAVRITNVGLTKSGWSRVSKDFVDLIGRSTPVTLPQGTFSALTRKSQPVSRGTKGARVMQDLVNGARRVARMLKKGESVKHEAGRTGTANKIKVVGYRRMVEGKPMYVVMPIIGGEAQDSLVFSCPNSAAKTFMRYARLADSARSRRSKEFIVI